MKNLTAISLIIVLCVTVLCRADVHKIRAESGMFVTSGRVYDTDPNDGYDLNLISPPDGVELRVTDTDPNDNSQVYVANWTPTEAQLGSHTIEIRATENPIWDGHKDVTVALWSLLVLPPDSPVVIEVNDWVVLQESMQNILEILEKYEPEPVLREESEGK